MMLMMVVMAIVVIRRFATPPRVAAAAAAAIAVVESTDADAIRMHPAIDDPDAHQIVGGISVAHEATATSTADANATDDAADPDSFVIDEMVQIVMVVIVVHVMVVVMVRHMMLVLMVLVGYRSVTAGTDAAMVQLMVRMVHVSVAVGFQSALGRSGVEKWMRGIRTCCEFFVCG